MGVCRSNCRRGFAAGRNLAPGWHRVPGQNHGLSSARAVQCFAAKECLNLQGLYCLPEAGHMQGAVRGLSHRASRCYLVIPSRVSLHLLKSHDRHCYHVLHPRVGYLRDHASC